MSDAHLTGDGTAIELTVRVPLQDLAAVLLYDELTPAELGQPTPELDTNQILDRAHELVDVSADIDQAYDEITADDARVRARQVRQLLADSHDREEPPVN